MKETRLPFIDHHGLSSLNVGVLRYTWEQNLDEVILYLTAENVYGNAGKTPRILKEDLSVKMMCNRLTIQNKATGSQILDDLLFDKIDTSESLWYIENDELVLQLSKMRKGLVWSSVTKSNDGSTNPMDIVSFPHPLSARCSLTQNTPGKHEKADDARKVPKRGKLARICHRPAV
ncbi:hypothetical protein OJ253_1162 [Cryptosporidium canis]|uniref:CS domain-containing protein n=1 Tax=Cryptosporidium canis TaxID=195482 RepID=A0A9D5HY78_9CRYT|nr:hypothetical protein OJ253_1162 [Cryptosporidium canis]